MTTEGPEWLERQLEWLEAIDEQQSQKETPTVTTYWFKPKPEAVRAVELAMIVVLLQLLAATDVATITDFKTWAIGIGTGVAHAGIKATLALLGEGGFTK